MPKPNTPYDPQPERQDALGELAHEGYQAVPGNHPASIKSLQDRLGMSTENMAPTEAVVRTMRPRRWLAIAAGVAVLLVAGIAIFTYDAPQQQFAKVAAPVDQEQFLEDAEVTSSRIDVVADIEDESEIILLENGPAVAEEIRENAADNIGLHAGDLNDIEAAPTRQNSRVARPTKPSPEPNPVAAAPPAASNKLYDATSDVATEPMTNTPTGEDLGSLKKDVEPVGSILADNVIDMAEEEDSMFRMERAPVLIETREISGEVVEPSGVPVIGAILTVEETGQQVTTNVKGEFTISVSDVAIVGDITAEGYNRVLFDLTAGDEFKVYLPRVSSSIPSVQLKGKSIGLSIIYPMAERYPVFDAYIAQQQSTFSGEKVVVQFEVNRFGRPRQIISGPGDQNRAAVKKVKDWLRNGPDWSEEYQRKSWRYSIVMP